MKLRTRITIVTATVTTLSALVIGAVAITSSRTSAIALIDQSLTSVAKAIQGNSNDALSQAIYSGKQSDLALTIVFYSGDKAGAVLTDSKLNIVPNPTPTMVKKSSLKPQTVSGLNPYRLETVPLTNGEYLVVAASLKDADARLQSELLRLLIYMFLCLLVAGISTWLFVRRDMRKVEDLIDSATLISLGKATPELPISHGNSEIDQLTRALNQMVTTLQHATEVEEESNNRMQEFMGDASHELRTPLTVVKGYVELLSGSAMTDPDQRRMAYTRVQSEILRMESLIQDILFLAEFGQKRVEDVQTVEISQLLLSHVGDFATLNKARSVEIQIEPNVEIHGSDAHLARLFSNALGNISRHTPPSAPVRVGLNVRENSAHIIIEDGGPGLPESAYIQGIQGFQRFDRSRSRENGGSGLGMSIILAIVREHGGSVSLSKSDLGGLKMMIVLPCR
jgi:two-component system, OmpR family, sensor kinase